MQGGIPREDARRILARDLTTGDKLAARHDPDADGRAVAAMRFAAMQRSLAVIDPRIEGKREARNSVRCASAMPFQNKGLPRVGSARYDVDLQAAMLRFVRLRLRLVPRHATFLHEHDGAALPEARSPVSGQRLL